MGLGVYLIADLPRRGWLKKPPARDRLFQMIVAATSAFVARQPAPLAGWMSATVRENVLRLNLFPLEEDVELSIDGGRIVCSAKTSTAGPGYHAYLIDLLDELERVEGLIWDEQIEDSQDETGYRASRDFELLQSSMADWLRFLARHVLEKMADCDPPILLGMPIGFLPRTAAFAASPMGEWPREWLAEIGAAEGNGLLALASGYFSWWEQGLSAGNLRSFGLARCWMDVSWTTPRNARERAVLESALGCFDAATRLDPAIPLPTEVGELKRLLSDSAPLAAPSPTGIGFLRRPMTLSLPGDWTIDLPGYFWGELEEDGRTQVYSFLGKTVRGSSLSFTPRENAIAVDLFQHGSQERDERPLSMQKDYLVGKYTCLWDAEQGCHILQAKIAKLDSLCIVTITFDEAADRPWAESVAATVSAPPPAAP